jgi:hypothetical protein
MTSGKWYWEVSGTGTYDGNNGPLVGISKSSATLASYPGNDANGWGYYSADGDKYTGASASAYGSTWTGSDVIGIAFDADNGTLTFYKNNVSQGTAFTGLTSGPYFPATGIYGTATSYINFGQRAFAYTAPSGFKALNTANLPAPLVTKPSDVMDVALYTGNGSTQTISGLGFSPDLVWIKNRAAADNHKLTDIVRGATEELESNTDDAEATNADGLTQFNADGFDLGDDDEYNTSSEAYVAWAWDAGTSTVTNTDGSISSQVRANASAGFSVVTYTGNATAGATVGHGLGVAPSFVICKTRQTAAANEWTIYHQSLGNTKSLYFTTAAASGSDAGFWNNTSPTSTVVTLGNYDVVNASGISLIMYAWAPVAGYSSFGSYTGNGSADGPFVYTGFRPRWILFKESSASGNSWFIYDSVRGAYNVVTQRLVPDASLAELTNFNTLDMLSNGWKVRDSNSAWNASGATYIYAAFAEHPFQYARAR